MEHVFDTAIYNHTTFDESDEIFENKIQTFEDFNRMNWELR